MVKRSVVVGGHKTSVSLEDAFWTSLKDIATRRGMTLSNQIDTIDRSRKTNNLSSAIRLFVLDHFRARDQHDVHRRAPDIAEHSTGGINQNDDVPDAGGVSTTGPRGLGGVAGAGAGLIVVAGGKGCTEVGGDGVATPVAAVLAPEARRGSRFGNRTSARGIGSACGNSSSSDIGCGSGFDEPPLSNRSSCCVCRSIDLIVSHDNNDATSTDRTGPSGEPFRSIRISGRRVAGFNTAAESITRASI